MYVFWFFEFLFEVLSTPYRLFAEIIPLLLDTAESILTFISVFPIWLSVPFYVLICIAILFRVSQFIPTIGGAS